MDKIRQQLELLTGNNAWVAYIFTIVFLTLLFNFILQRVLLKLEARCKLTKNLWDDALIYAVRIPVRLFVWVMGLSFAGEVVNLLYVNKLRELGIIISLAWAIVRFIKIFEIQFVSSREQSGHKIDHTTADAISQLLRVSVIITAALVALQSMGFNISAILAFGGIGGIAVGFAAKDLLANFFGGLMIYLDRPFAVGDWVRSPDRDIEGTVEKIGWRLTVIRTFDKRPVYIPNSLFATIALENPSRMSNRRIYETIGVRYADIQHIADIVTEVKAMLQAHPDIAQNQTMIVNFNKFNASSVDFFIYTFTKTTDWIEFHRIKQDVLLKISEIITRRGAEIAFPTSTVHVPDGLAVHNDA